MQKIKYESKRHLLKTLEEHRYEFIEVLVNDVVNMVAELRNVSRGSILQTAVTAWFSHALGFQVLEAECHEQAQSEDTTGGVLLFRLRLEANYDEEVRSLKAGEDLTTKYRGALIGALPWDLVARKCGSSLEQMVQISWTKPGSVELGGLAAMGLIVLIVMALGAAGTCRCELCYVCASCCTERPGKGEGAEYSCALRELRERGAEFEVNPDGSASLRVPPYRDGKWRCPDCSIL